MARIMMKTAPTNTVEELFPAFLSAATARSVMDNDLLLTPLNKKNREYEKTARFTGKKILNLAVFLSFVLFSIFRIA